ncbi:DUF3857 domain-containing protein [Aureisphaera galaxeae]|uniref:DUF3857 domain-containing protein n=1 Tax=Aureisphaera galaxeae TaxID=1538023 RepID=UPI002350F9ED|nr:DUF3857 domain-containing protein [Aureisphaera galaxeae]MDC8003173.1 DUF3857 domain-containing protein [Aureisphaera galaxeae]
MRNPILLLICFLTFTAAVQGQDYKFGKAIKNDVLLKQDVKFPEANAVVLFREVTVFLGSEVEVYERIKIFNEEGYDHATVRIPYPDVKRVKGATYNLVNGAVEKTELDKNLIFTDEEIKGVKIKKFSFPNVNAGSVIEFSYRTDRGTFANIHLQHDIPIKREKIHVTNNTGAGVEILQNPRAFLDVARVEEGKTTNFIANNVPALEHENYVYDMDVYRSFLKINVTAFGDFYKFNNWKSLGGKIISVDYFSQGMKAKKFYRDDIEAALGGEIDQLKKARIVYNLLRDKVKWNENYGYIPDQSVRETYKKGEGGLDDINILLVSMLESVGIDAAPVLVSTKRNGIPLSASGSAFNGVLASAVIAGKTYLLDGAHHNSRFDYLASHFLNWQGLRIFQDHSFDWVTLENNNVSAKNIIGQASIDEDLMISGNVRERHSGYYGIYKDSEIEDLGENKIETILDYDADGLEVNEVKADAKKEGIVDVSFAFEMENAIDEIDGKLYFSPLLFTAIPENPFQKEERKYSIDFEYLLKDQTMMTIKIPEGYQVESLPEAIKFSLPDNMGSFIYRISAQGTNIQVQCAFQINTPLMPYDTYDSLKEFFKVRMDKETEKVVLSKV